MRTKYIFIDTETTGDLPSLHFVHQISGEIFIDGKSMETFDLRIRVPKKAVFSEEAINKLGLDRTELTENPDRLSPREAYQYLTKMMLKYVSKFDKNDKFFLVGFNVPFDRDFLNSFFRYNGDEFLFSYIWGNVIDTMALVGFSLIKQRHLMESFKLGVVLTYLGYKIDEDKLHDSLYDIYLTVILFNHFLPDNEKVRTALYQESPIEILPPITEKEMQLAVYGYVVEDDATEEFEGMPLESPEPKIPNTMGLEDNIKICEINDYFLFGKKHYGKPIAEILDEDPQYLLWYENEVNKKKFLLADNVIKIAIPRAKRAQELRKAEYIARSKNSAKQQDFEDPNNYEDLPF